MKVLEFLRSESQLSVRRIGVLAVIAGLSNVAILAIINAAAGLAADRAVNLRLGIMFVILIVLYVFAQREVMGGVVTEVELIAHRVRVRLIGLLQKTDLPAFEHIGRSAIYAGITRDATTIAQAAPALVTGIQSAVLLLFASVYMAALSMVGFALVASFVIVAMVSQLRRRQQYRDRLHQATERENEMLDRLSDILDGFKEIQMSSRRGRDIFADASAASQAAVDLHVKNVVEWAGEFIRIQVIFFLLPGVVVFLVPRFSSVPNEDIAKMTATVLFFIGPITYLGSSIGVFTTLNVAAENLFNLEALLIRAGRRELPERTPGTSPRDFSEGFREIALDGVTFQHPAGGGQEFTLGPIGLTVHAGEMLFISGGNGAGKSTLIKVLAGLYKPIRGAHRVDGTALAEDEYQAYRDRIAVIFSDYHLFRRLYGVDAPAAARAHELLEFLGLQDKTRLIGDRFETLDLSMGQRKRLALMVTLLEDRPLMIFDEWAAEQDPGFRAKFYREVLPGLRSAGKTLVVITHDDRYFDVADRHLRIEEGVIVERPEAERSNT